MKNSLSRRRFLKTSTIAGTAGISGIYSTAVAQYYNSLLPAGSPEGANKMLSDKPVGRFSGVSIDNIKDPSILFKGDPASTPFLERFRNIHPRILFTSSDLEKMKGRLDDRCVKRFYKTAGILERKAPAFKPGSRNGGGYTDLGSYALSFLLEPDDKKLKPILDWLETATTYPHVGTDLDAEYFMEGIALTYDWLYEYIPDELRNRVRDTIARQCREVYEVSVIDRILAGSSYQQNHFWFSNLSLALGASAIYGEVPEAEKWLPWAWDRYERIALTFSPDGGFHEGPHYWDYSMPTFYKYTDLYEWFTGLHAYYADKGLRGQAEFGFHQLYPGLELTAALQDTGLTKGRPAEKIFLWEAKRFKDPVTMGMAEILTREPKWNSWNLLWLDEKLKSADPLKNLPLGKYYPDIETVFARTGWDNDATYIAFVCRPLGGHQNAELYTKFKIGGTGHNHPEQNHFIVFGKGEVLAADPGYTYEKQTRNHNTVLINGKGQYGDGEMWPRPNPGRAHITHFVNKEDITIVTGDATSAYPKELGLTLFERTLVLAGRDLVIVYDRLSSEKPGNFSWLIHHYGNISSEKNGTWTITRNNAQLGINLVMPENFKAETSTYRPQFIHPERNLTPIEADINLLELKSELATEATFLTPLFINDAGNKTPEIMNFSSKNCNGIRTGDLLVAFNNSNDIMEIPLPGGKSVNTKAKVLIATITNKKYKVVLTSGT